MRRSKNPNQQVLVILGIDIFNDTLGFFYTHSIGIEYRLNCSVLFLCRRSCVHTCGWMREKMEEGERGVRQEVRVIRPGVQQL